MTSNEGYTIFKSVGIVTNYNHVDLTKKQVKASILYKNEIKMTMIVDLNASKVYKDGNIDELLDLIPEMDENSYIEEIKRWAKVFIENKITNPEEYFDSLIRNSL